MTAPKQKKHFKFPRRFSRAHCMSKSCKKMGFTEKASCRPYKNCYKSKMGGGKTRKASKNKKDSGNVSPSRKHMNHPDFVFHSEHVSYTSHPDGKTPYGKRTVVDIKNNSGTKKLMVLNKAGKTIKVNSKKLKTDEVKELKMGNYVPRLWATL